MAVPTYTLYVKPADEDPLKLRLSQDPDAADSDEAPRQSILANAKVMFVLRGFTLPRLTATLFIEGAGVVPCYTEPVSGDLFLYPEEDRPPFAANIGSARITLLVSAGGLKVKLVSEPLEIVLRPGIASSNLTAMARCVRAETARLYGNDAAVIRRLSGLSERLRIISEIAELYDRQYPYYRENARYQLRGTRRIEAIERIRTLASDAAGWLMSHAHELERVRTGTGLRAGGKTWLPRHAPTIVAEQDRDIPENRAVAGFPLTIRNAVAEILKAADDAEGGSGKPGDVIRSSDFLPCLTPAEAELLRNEERTFLRLGSIYRDALCRDAAPLTGLPSPTAHFLSTAQYRLMYEAMKRWFALPPVSLAEIRRELNALTGARLFEYYTLVRLIEGAEAAGFVFEASRRHVYSSLIKHYEMKAGAPIDNTFVFRKGDAMLTLYYQPVIGSKEKAGENGLTLCRATTLSFKAMAGEPVDTLREGAVNYYTPDYAVSLTRGDQTAWAVGDAKYSTAQKVRRSSVASLAFKYLVSIRPTNPGDVYAGVWLWCGFALADETSEPLGSIFDAAASAGDVPQPDLVLEKLTALNANGNPLASLLERLDGLLG